MGRKKPALSHVDATGRARMVDVSAKAPTMRQAVAVGHVAMSAAARSAIRGTRIKKGDPLSAARLAGIMAAKKTADLIPLCHPLPLTHADVALDAVKDGYAITATVRTMGPTGVEMEALTAATIAALTVYDMTKMVDEDVEIENVRLVEKRGGKSDFVVAQGATATVITVSDSRKQDDDRSGPTAVGILEEAGVEVSSTRIVSDDADKIKEAIETASGRLIVLTGGTGVGPRDNTPEVVRQFIEKELPGVAEQIRRYGQDRTPTAMLSRTVCGITGDRLVLCLPGAPKGVEEGLRAVLPHLLHVLDVLKGAGHGARA